MCSLRPNISNDSNAYAMFMVQCTIIHSPVVRTCWGKAKRHVITTALWHVAQPVIASHGWANKVRIRHTNNYWTKFEMVHRRTDRMDSRIAPKRITRVGHICHICKDLWVQISIFQGAESMHQYSVHRMVLLMHRSNGYGIVDASI